MSSRLPIAAASPAPDPFGAVRRSFGRQGFMRHLGAQMTAAGPGFVEVEVDADPRLSQQHGFFHGGVVATLADVAGGYAAFTVLEGGGSCVTVEFKVSFLVPARGSRLCARGTVLRSGRRLTVCRSDVLAVADGRERLCATALATFAAVGPEEAGDHWRGSSSAYERERDGR